MQVSFIYTRIQSFCPATVCSDLIGPFCPATVWIQSSPPHTWDGVHGCVHLTC